MNKIYRWMKRKIFAIDDRPILEIAKERGMKVGDNVFVQDGCTFDISHCWLIEIGNDVMLAPRVNIIAHDASTKWELGYTLIGHVIIGNNVFVGAGSTILPNVTIGDNVVIGAGSVVTHDIPENSVVAGNPAKEIMSYSQYMNKRKEQFSKNELFEYEYTLRGGITTEQKEEMKKIVKDGVAGIK